MNMRQTTSSKLALTLALTLLIALVSPVQALAQSNKQERNHVRAGNTLYKNKRYAEAEVEYRKALQANPNSEMAQFNLATALLRQGNATTQQDDNKSNPVSQAQGLLSNLAKNASSKQLRGKAYYDLGNIAYNQQQFDQAIEYYKNALRCDPDDDQARNNLRMAQLKKQQQDKNKNDKNQDKDNQNNKDNNQDNQKDQNQDQNKDQNQDQNQDKDQNQNDQQNQDQQNQDNGQGQQDQQQQQQQQQGGMSQQNAEQVLKAMQDQERATQQRINAQKAQQQRHERQRTNKKW